MQSQLNNYFYPQQKLVSKVRKGAKVTKKHDKARTPYHRAIDHTDMTVARIVALTRRYSLINPAATQRQALHRRIVHPHHRQGRPCDSTPSQQTRTIT